MPQANALSPALSVAVTLTVLLLGAFVTAVLSVACSATARRPLTQAVVEPLRQAALLLRQESTLTERPDLLLWVLAPAAYAGVAALALTVVPLAQQFAVADVRTGVVLFGAAEALAIIAIFSQGWASNSHFSLLGGFRFIALGLSYELLSMFALIAAALPAESLQVSAIVAAQAELWNVVRQPLGLPLWMIVTWGVTFTGPLALNEGNDLASGTSLEVSGRALLLWQLARASMLTVFCGMGAAVFLGGWHGPALSGAGWMVLKTVALLFVVIWVGYRLPRLTAERAMNVLWIWLLPLAFLHLLLAGIEALI